MTKKGSKNNIEHRGTGVKLKQVDGRNIKPVQYVASGRKVVVGKYEDGGLVLDREGNPIPYSSI